MKVIYTWIFLFISMGGFAQTKVRDSVVFESYCECLEDVYFFKKEFLKSITTSDEKVRLDSSYIEKHNFTIERYRTIDSQCSELDQPASHPCIYEQKIMELRDDWELIRRVIEMNSLTIYCGPLKTI